MLSNKMVLVTIKWTTPNTTTPTAATSIAVATTTELRFNQYVPTNKTMTSY